MDRHRDAIYFTDLGLICDVCNRITVMGSGEAVEVGTMAEVFNTMRHPYTRGLFNSIPLPGRINTPSRWSPCRANCFCPKSG